MRITPGVVVLGVEVVFMLLATFGPVSVPTLGWAIWTGVGTLLVASGH